MSLKSVQESVEKDHKALHGIQSQTPRRSRKVDPAWSSILYTMGHLESRIGGSTFWMLLGALGSHVTVSWQTASLSSTRDLLRLFKYILFPSPLPRQKVQRQFQVGAPIEASYIYIYMYIHIYT